MAQAAMGGAAKQSARRPRRRPLLAGALTLPLLLAGCGAWEEFFGEEPQPTRVEVPPASAEAEAPSLGSIPERRQSSPEAQREALRAGLQQDREAAAFYQQPGQEPSPAGETGEQAAEEAMAPRRQALGSEPPPRPSASGVPPAPPARAGFEGGDATQGGAGRTDSAPRAATSTQTAATPRRPAAPAPQVPLRRELVGVIYFAHGSSNLDSRDREVLQQVRSRLEGTGGQLRVVGHASMRTGVMDPARHARANFEISQQRAASVANELNRLGVPDAALAIEAAGAQQPVFYEFMPTGEAGNRRVEIYLEY